MRKYLFGHFVCNGHFWIYHIYTCTYVVQNLSIHTSTYICTYAPNIVFSNLIYLTKDNIFLKATIKISQNWQLPIILRLPQAKEMRFSGYWLRRWIKHLHLCIHMYIYNMNMHAFYALFLVYKKMCNKRLQQQQ